MLISSDKVFSLIGYQILEQIYYGSKTLVYRGIREQDQMPVVIKLIRNEYPTFSEIAQFRNQYTITKNLNVPGIIQPLCLENHRNGYALIMEDFGGISLKEWVRHRKIAAESEITLKEFFPIAIAIASILGELHHNRIIHKDIKPANILINPDTLEVRIIDFSIATLLPREIQYLKNPNILEGTLAYISPEQTGRMNRGIDYRSDFYSLGVSFFELLTGQLPFSATEPIELVHAHIAKQPPSLHQINPNHPSILSAIISKLMAKNAEDRYQSAYGLKYDLETCYHQLQVDGNVQNFELATKDISDRFLISEKLYGRQQEVATLLAAFERVARGNTEMILVAGCSGIGKTAIVNEVHKPIARQHSYFIKGKFDQFQRDIPLSALVQAFQDLIGQILVETDAQIQQWKDKILAALGEQAQVIIDVIPHLEQIIGKQPAIPTLSGSAAQNRFNLLFQRFIQVFSNQEHPLVIFVDDLQWADSASLQFIQLLMSQANVNNRNSALGSLATQENAWIPIFEGEAWEFETAANNNQDNDSLLLIGAYRDNEVSQAHPLYLTLKEIAAAGININQITLTPLTQENLNLLISDTLGCQEEVAIPLSQMVFAKTKGNPFFATQFLKCLHQDGTIKINFDLGYWQYNLQEIQAFALTDDVVDFMAQQIKKLPIATQNVLKLAACIGNEFDLKTLAIVYEKSVVDTATDLWNALHEGIILPQTDLYKLFQIGNNLPENLNNYHNPENLNISNQVPKYKFIHDRVQQAAYSLISEKQKKQIHLNIGTLLFENIPENQREENIFQLVNQFNTALELLTSQDQRNEIAQMNFIAGRKALSSTAYTAAIKYLITAIALLSSDSWETQYELTLSLYETAAEAAYLAGKFKQMEQLVDVVLAKATTLLEKVKVYELKIKAYGAQNKALEAIQTALIVLKQLGVDFPENPTQYDVQLAMTEAMSNLTQKGIEELINLPEMTAACSLAVMRILSNALFFAYSVSPELFPLIVIKQINISRQNGNAPLSAFAYVLYGMILCNVVKDIESGYQFGKLALSLLTKYNAREVESRVKQVFNAGIHHWKQHPQEILKPLLESYAIGLETGDLEFAALSIQSYCLSCYFVGKELIWLEREIASYSQAISETNQERAFKWNEIYRQSILNLLGNGEYPWILIGEAYDEEKMLPIHLANQDGIGLLHLYVNKLYLCYLFQQYPQAIENANIAEKYLDSGTGQLHVPLFYFYDSLARLAVYNTSTTTEQSSILDKVRANQEKIQKWADHASMNYLHKFYLVEAEQYRVTGKYLEAIDYYERAIVLAKENHYINEEALANELAAKFYLEWGKEKIAKTYLTDAYYCYVRWEAKAKVDDLEKCYPQLLMPILQREKISIQLAEKIAVSTSQSLSHQTSNQIVNSSKTSISDSLDLATVIKASQALSGEIEMEQLLSKLMQVVMENAGASKSALILSEADNLELRVTATSSDINLAPITTQFPSISVEPSNDIPITLMKYVKRTGEVFVADDVKTIAFLASDRYIIHNQPKSLLCIPIVNQGKLLGILYLENNLTTGAFTRDRIEVIKLLTTQAAISLENAILYENLAKANQSLAEYSHSLEEKVETRTQELYHKNQHLQQTLQELQRTQAQLIQSEKMSSLGQMVAGIAHEINNPINFIHGNIAHTTEYVQDLLDLLTIYQEEYPHPSDLVQEKAAEIDIDFLAEDLRKILDSMKLGSSRIRNIVLSLRNFSRLDESDMKVVNIHEGIDNTLMILRHRLKGKNDYSEIEVIKNYAQIPAVSCYPGQLNQVFMNILSNAIDALDESIVSQHVVKPQIRISTELISTNHLRICIADNGVGMPESVKQKIFDPFFTTKPVGSGTGLGLSISYQVIVDKHKGQLTCNSTVGQGTELVIEIPIH
ncbi:ATP-binding sensor histidine kinase [Nostoc sp. FACHB-110]|uniref:trifunctional serine/threonine-protein kinase/ATP-binding protein/sensor histidine kinase n=1 Tax=Nostoc sp. FACHB-110 TaxID=2692834 RepID=UPI00168937CE|nr:ATP-binding sensor histidine kinase [Nostoc sp. FACHB-110]MBD2440396.1 AAA family ATPase [Nostoc sp. FACHB-110]